MFQINNIEFSHDRLLLKDEFGKEWITVSQDLIYERNAVTVFYEIDDYFETGNGDVMFESL
jgi:hypothetical protein